MKKMLKRLKEPKPKNLYPTLRAWANWILFGDIESVWEHGYCYDRKARRHKIKRNVQFVLWQAGEQGHNEAYWHNFDESWWCQFNQSLIE